MLNAAIQQPAWRHPRFATVAARPSAKPQQPTSQEGVQAQGAAPITSYSPERAPIAEPARAAGYADCACCSSRRFCMPDGYDAQDATKFKGVFGNSRKVKRGEAIFRAGEPFENLYVTRAGSSKTIIMHHDGREQITGFQIAGEFFGMEGISTGRHEVDAIALEDSIVCSVPFSAITALCERDFGLQTHIHKLMSRELVRESALLMLIGTMNAVERVVEFLLSLSKRFADRGYSAHQLNLRMTREEIGCHLGLKLETVSRGFSRLTSLGLIQCSGRQITITDMAGLERIHRDGISR